jgi:hypothetical protein
MNEENKFYCVKDGDGILRPMAGIWRVSKHFLEDTDNPAIKDYIKRHKEDRIVKVQLTEIIK